jgi:molybdenum cofactor cytidylyltransferase
VEGERLSGLDSRSLDGLLALAEARQLPLLVEADGSRRLPLKAPADHEPAIPGWVDTVVVVAGLSGLGAPLSGDWVHRPERFSELSGLALGEPVTPQALQRLLLNPQGGLKGIPGHARRLVLLNQAETPERQAAAASLAGSLLGAYQAVLVSALAPPAGTSVPGASAVEAGVIAVHEPVAGVVLAAGASRRLGSPKQLLSWRGEPLVRQVARVALDAGLSPVVVVTGSSAPEVGAVLQGLPLTEVFNPDWEGGQSTSLVAGLRTLPMHAGAAIFLLSDQPQVPVDLLRSLVASHSLTLAPIVAPLVDGHRSNPVLFDRQVFPALSSLSGDVGGRAIFSRFPVAWVPWHDASILLDVDTPADYQALLEL